MADRAYNGFANHTSDACARRLRGDGWIDDAISCHMDGHSGFDHPHQYRRDFGVGAARRVNAVRWNVAKDIVVAWMVTMPATAILGAAFYLIAVAAGIK
jgi:hypothetical protein